LNAHPTPLVVPEPGPEDGPSEAARARSLEEDLRSCLRIAGFVFRESSLDAFLHLVLEEAVSRLGADRGGIFLHEPSENALYGFAMTGVTLSPSLRLDASRGIVGEVVRTGATLNIPDAYSDARFAKEVDVLTGYRTRSIVCAPILSHEAGSAKSRVWGALELLNPVGKGRENGFDAFDEESLRHILVFAALRLNEHATVGRLLREKAEIASELAVVKGTASEEEVLRKLVGISDAMKVLRALVASVAPFDSNVLVHGESGTGKELVAQCLHALSPRREKPFVALNCAAIPESLMEAELFGIESGVATGVNKRIGKLEQAQGGTLFLDEIGEMSQPTQAKLLRALQEKEITRVGGKQAIHVDVRFVSATHRDLTEMIAQKAFREDLYYRLHVVQVELPPLRERKGDVAFLAAHFLAQLCQRYPKAEPKMFTPRGLEALESRPWKGNVRELQNEVERAYVLSGTGTRYLSAEHCGMAALGPGPHGGTAEAAIVGEVVETGTSPESNVLPVAWRGRDLMTVVDDVERVIVRAALETFKGNKTKAAEHLGISREGLRKMLARWGDEA